jgi:hypothetical protein
VLDAPADLAVSTWHVGESWRVLQEKYSYHHETKNAFIQSSCDNLDRL